MSLISVRSFILASFAICALVLLYTPENASAQIATATPTPTSAFATATPTPTTATTVEVATPTSVIFETPTPELGPTGPVETFAIIGLGSIALVVLGALIFFVF